MAEPLNNKFDLNYLIKNNFKINHMKSISQTYNCELWEQWTIESTSTYYKLYVVWHIISSCNIEI